MPLNGSHDITCDAGEAFNLVIHIRNTDGTFVDLTDVPFVFSTFNDAGVPIFDDLEAIGLGSSVTILISGDYTFAASKQASIRYRLDQLVSDGVTPWMYGFVIAQTGSNRRAVGASAPSVRLVNLDPKRGSVILSPRGAPGVPQWQAMGFDSAAAYDAKLHADAVTAVLASTGPIEPTHGVSVGGETTIPAPAPVPADKTAWVAVYINGIRQRPGAYTSAGSTTLTLAGPLDQNVEWIVDQLQRNPA